MKNRFSKKNETSAGTQSNGPVPGEAGELRSNKGRASIGLYRMEEQGR